MLVELKEGQELFQTADCNLSAHMNPILAAFGMPTEAIQVFIKHYISRAESEDKVET